MLPLSLLVAAHLFAAATARRLLHSLPEDTYAFPKFHVVFLNGQPVPKHTAHNWLTHGLVGGEQQFLHHTTTNGHPVSPKEIESGGPLQSLPANYSLEQMKMGSGNSYLCLIPKSAPSTPAPPEEEEPDDLVPARGWSLLQPLAGTCLYHRQGWFTYSYCHNEEIRQFKEASQAQPNIAGGYKPEEDPEWESYSLGKAPKPGADLTVAEQNARAVNLELARNAGSRYLVQRWSDGTLCDKTGRSREVEVQFHCSMTMTDTILFIKETKTCSYVVVINTPRLCGEPGFKSRKDIGEEAQIRCREIVDAKPEIPTNLPVSDHPIKPARSKPIPPPPERKAENDKAYEDFLRQTIAALGGTKDIKGPTKLKTEGGDEVVIEVLGEDFMTNGQVEAVEKLTEALRKMGYDIQSDKGNKKEQPKKQTAKKFPRHEEL
ncbi:hypothetical protein BDZ94DRAFT_1203843 [Collybia nuda]|uniref:Protein OS-9 homolog n=1 Tax=Collybia nuda TaxID=64659 RepID=A0A9P5XWE6_9AGAR|nr:hypothetical protein BDZ94DRAFT_1203843 [Collybia nuda]